MGNYDSWKTTEPEPWSNGKPPRYDETKRCRCGRPSRMTGMLSREPRCDECGREEARVHILGSEKVGAA